MTKVVVAGHTLDSRTASMLATVTKLVGHPLRISQGSYSTSTGASAGTHAGGGAVDLSTRGLTPKQKLDLVRAMRTVGFASWLRPYTPNVWGEHIHSIAIGCPDMSRAAAQQVVAYRSGRDGLAGNGRDPQAGLKVGYTTWEKYRASLIPPFPGKPFGLGAVGVHVSAVQRALKIAVTSKFDATTRNAVKAYQRRHVTLWPADGIVGPRTYAAITGRK